MRWKTKDKSYGIQKPTQHFVSCLSKQSPLPPWYLPRHTSTPSTWQRILFPHPCPGFSPTVANLPCSNRDLLTLHCLHSLIPRTVSFSQPCVISLLNFLVPTFHPSWAILSSPLPSSLQNVQNVLFPFRNVPTILARWRRSVVHTTSTTKVTQPAPLPQSHQAVDSAAALLVASPLLMPAKL